MVKKSLNPLDIVSSEKPNIREFNRYKTKIAGFKIYDLNQGMDLSVDPLNTFFESVKLEKLVLVVYTDELVEGIRAKNYFKLSRDLNVKTGCNITFILEYQGTKTLLGKFLDYFGVKNVKSFNDFQNLFGQSCETIVKKTKNREILQIYFPKD